MTVPDAARPGRSSAREALVVERLAEVHEAPAAPGADGGAGGLGHASDGTRPGPSGRLGSRSMECRLGVLAFGDSITNGGGELQWGVALQSWALWVARGLGLPYTGCAVDGARAADVVRAQIPAFAARGRDPDARFDVGCLYAGVNDVRVAGLGPAGVRAATSATRSRSSPRAATACSCARSRSTWAARAPARACRDANARIRRAAARARRARRRAGGLRGAQPRDGRRRASDRLRAGRAGRAGARRARRATAWPCACAPSSLIAYETTRWRRLRGDATYVYRQAKQAGHVAVCVGSGQNCAGEGGSGCLVRVCATVLASFCRAARP